MVFNKRAKCVRALIKRVTLVHSELVRVELLRSLIQ